MTKTWARSEPLLEAHIKNLSIGVIEKHLKSFRGFLGGGRSGIYVLRKDEDLYYVGLASSLRGRLQDHIDDRLKGRWDRFDLYILRRTKAKYLRDLEALLIRVAKPPGNRTEPNFVKHNNLGNAFKKVLSEDIKILTSSN